MKINDNNAFLMASGDGSRIEIHAVDAKKDSWTQISQTAEAGDNTLVLAEDTGWKIGDKIAIAASGFDMSEAEERTIIKVDGRTVTLDAPLEHQHFGKIETYDNGLEGEAFRSWDVDMRAEVALLSRNVTIQGDEGSVIDGYGGHTMIMNEAQMHIDGAELTRMGQIGDVGRYPLHWHMLGDASGQYVTNSSIHETYNKGMTIHGTQNTWVENVAIYDTIGHTYYFEDGSEYGNVLKNTLGMNTKASANLEDAAIGSDVEAVSTYWVTNPQNHLIDNHAAGSEHSGFWMLSQNHAEGKSAVDYPDLVPRKEAPGTWEGNLSHTNKHDGIFIGAQFDETTGEKSDEPTLEVPFLLKDFTSYKNGEWGIWQRNARGDFEDVKIAESNVGVQIWGDSKIDNSLFVGRTANTNGSVGQMVGWQLYDHGVDVANVHFEGFTAALDTAISNGWGFGRSTQHTVEGLTFGDDTDASRFKHTLTINSDGVSDTGGAIAGAVIDLDGSLTGVEGAVLTPGVIDFNPNENIDVLTYADPSKDAAGFNAPADAVWLEESQAWVNAPGTVIGKMAVQQWVRDTDGTLQEAWNVDGPKNAEKRVAYTVERSDTGAKLLISKDAIVDYAPSVQFNVDTSEGVEYIFDYSAETPDALSFDLSDLPMGASAFYRIKGLPEGVVFQKADAVASAEALDAATGTSWFRDENGDYLIKAVADDYFFWRQPRGETDIASERIYNDEFKLFITDPKPEEATGDSTQGINPEDHLPKASEPIEPPTLEELQNSDGENNSPKTVEISDADARWSDAATWGGKVPGIEDIVVIGPGQRVVLDTFVWVKAIFVNGGELIVEDTKDLKLAADWILVNEGGLFQVGTEDTPFQHDFELTLEGDDEENDVDPMALKMADAEGIVRAVTPEAPTETTQQTTEDKDDARPWEYFTDTFDADGVRLARTTVYDDGRLNEMSFEGGVRAASVLYDASNSKAWETFATAFDAQGKHESTTQTFDDGYVTETLFVDGIRASQITRDVENTKGWSEILTTFTETGALLERVSIQDDGRETVMDFVGGVRSLAVTQDVNGAVNWSNFVQTFDDAGVITEAVRTYDDGHTHTTTYVDGVRSTTLSRDVNGTKNWIEVEGLFENGLIAIQTYTFDDGRVLVDTFDEGVRADRIVTDTGERPWDTIETSYAANGAILSTKTTNDDGTVVETNHISLVDAFNMGKLELDYTTSNGLLYQADPFGQGNDFGTGAEISGTEQDEIYKSERWAKELTYEVAVEKSGDYLLELNFAEIYDLATPGSRVMDIYVEDELVFDNLDLADQVGLNAALDVMGRTEVSDGALSIRLVGEVGNAKLSGFSVWEADGTGSDTFILGSFTDDLVFA